MNLPKLSIERPVFVSSILVLILILGLVSYRKLGVEQFPDINYPVISVTTTYRGVGPEEIEDLVTKPLEEELSGLAGIKKITSNSVEGTSQVVVEFTLETDTDWAERHVQDKVNQARSKLPTDADLPVVRRFDPSDSPIAILSYRSELPNSQAYDVADQYLKPRLSQVPGVAVVDIYGATKREIWVELDRDKLYAHRLTLGQVASKIGNNGSNTAVGKVHLGPQDLIFRVLGEYRDMDRLRQTVVNFNGSDVAVPLSSLGNVRDTVQDPTSRVFDNGQPSVFLQVYRQTKANVVQTVDGIERVLPKINQELQAHDPGASVALVYNTARSTKETLADAKGTILLAIVLTVLVVYLFLGSFRSTIITITALPVSLSGAFILMKLMGFTLNVISLLALSMAVGLLVDDAIVVRENIWRRVEEGEEPVQAAEKGTLQVAMAVVATTSVVIAVFLPIGFLSGFSGEIFRQLGLTVCFAMAVSLFESMTMGPMLSAYWVKRGSAHGRKPDGRRGGSGLLAIFGRFQDGLVDRYGHVMDWCLCHRWKVIGAALIVTLLSLGLMPFIPMNFMSNSDTGEFEVALKAKPGTSLEGMTDWALKVEGIIRKHPEVALITTTVGGENGSSNTGQMYIRLVDRQRRKLTTSDFKELMRAELKPYEVTLQPEIGDVNPAGGSESPFNLVLEGPDFEKVVGLAGQVMETLKSVKGLTDLRMDYEGGEPEFQVKTDPVRMKLFGVSAAQVGQELRDQVEGAKPAKFRENGLEYDIRVRLLEPQRNIQANFTRIMVPNQNGNLVRLSDVASPITVEGPSKIDRHNRVRSVMISGQLAKGGAIGNVTADVKKLLAGFTFPLGYRYSFEGHTEDLQDLIGNILTAIGLALVLTYLVLASLYESPVTPFTIMLAIPLAMAGALTALFLTHTQLDLFSMIGIVMLFGLVTKNSILLVDYTLQLQRRGMPRREALIQAGRVRLRPILMTTIAIIAGMLPVAMALSETGRFRQSMGVAVVGGIISSLFLTLLVVPSAYGIIDDVRLWFRRVLRMD